MDMQMTTCVLRSLNNNNSNPTARPRRLRVNITAVVRLSRTDNNTGSTDSNLPDRRPHMDMVLHLQGRMVKVHHPGSRAGIGVVSRRLHRGVDTQVLDMDLEVDSTHPRASMDNLLLGHLDGVGIHQDTEMLCGQILKQVGRHDGMRRECWQRMVGCQQAFW